MKTFLSYVLVGALFFVIGFYVAPDLLGGRSNSVDSYNVSNSFGGDDSTNSATTTASALPVEVLEANDDRKYALICNDSGTEIYLTLSNFDDPVSASTSILTNSGTTLAADGTYNDCLELTSANLYTGDIWATGTAASLVITYIEIN